MVFVLLSPAKKMEFKDARPQLVKTDVPFPKKTHAVANVMRAMSEKDLAKLMSISPALAKLNAERFHDFGKQEKEAAILAFQGDTYVGFDAKTLDDVTLKAADKHVGILSGLYGVLRPLDAIEPYRLEMGSSVSIDGSKNLYDFWRETVTSELIRRVTEIGAKAVIGCASDEYIRAVDASRFSVPFITCDFKENKNGKLSTVGLFAKRARGMMARYVVDNGIVKADDLKQFTSGGYAFDASLSSDDRLVYVR